jgi:hypothetical protein
MRKIAAAVLALALGLAPVVADSAPAVTGINLAPNFLAIGNQPTFGFNSASYANAPFMYELNPVLPIAGATVGFPITGFSMVCLPYSNANLDIVTGLTNYPYTLDISGGIGGGIVTIEEFEPNYGTANPPVVIATLSFPSSPHNGPYINYASVALGSPYVTTPGSTITAWVTSITAGPPQSYTGCVVTATI